LTFYELRLSSTTDLLNREISLQVITSKGNQLHDVYRGLYRRNRERKVEEGGNGIPTREQHLTLGSDATPTNLLGGREITTGFA